MATSITNDAEKPPLMHLELMDGVLIAPLTFRREIIADVLGYQARPGDIFIASYPKSGSSWTQYILWALLNVGKQEKTLPEFGKMMTQVSPFLELVSRWYNPIM